MHSGALVGALLASLLLKSIICHSAQRANMHQMKRVDIKDKDFQLHNLRMSEDCGWNEFAKEGKKHRKHKPSRSKSNKNFSSRIADGSNVERIYFPSLVQLVTRSELNYDFLCTGTLIHPRAVVTAAHCLQNRSDVWIGTSDKSGSLWPLHMVSNFKNVSYYCLPCQEYVDLAMLVLSEPFKLGPKIWPACLANSSLPDDSEASALGYGSMDDPPKMAETLRSLTVKKIACQDKPGVSCWDHSAGMERGTWCPGDSGGPILIFSGKRAYLHSVITGLGEYSCKEGSSFMHPGWAFDIPHFLNSTIRYWLEGRSYLRNTECFKAPYVWSNKSESSDIFAQDSLS